MGKALQTFDYVIVGAGAAGAVIAARLSDDRAVKVLVLEAGPRDDHLFLKLPLGGHAHRYPDAVWPYMSEPEPALGGRRLRTVGR